MKAIALTQYLPIEDAGSLFDIDLDMPHPTHRDILVKVEALSVNPVDTKVRSPKDKVEDTPKVLGWDACGTVASVGEGVSLFSPGDKVFYAGDITRSGSNAEYQLVDERIVGHAPTTLSVEQSAAIPLTALTAWEAIIDRLGVNLDGHIDEKLNVREQATEPKTLLIIGGAGGVGSMAIQIASKVAGLKVIATASKPESIAWCEEMGADHVINHYHEISTQLSDLGNSSCDYILCCNKTDMHFDAMVEVIKPQGKICSIVDNTLPLNLERLKPKSATFVWEFMFTRAMFKTEDMIEQHHILNEVARLLDEGIFKSTLRETISPINAANLRAAHKTIEQGDMVGKLVVKGWK